MPATILALSADELSRRPHCGEITTHLEQSRHPPVTVVTLELKLGGGLGVPPGKCPKSGLRLWIAEQGAAKPDQGGPFLDGDPPVL
jgi:hypothetical protein